MSATMPTERLVGEVEAVVYRSKTNDWSVIRVTSAKRRRLVVGYSGCHPGQVIEADGAWQEKPPYGKQFVAERIIALSPTTPRGLASYLSSGVLPGIGPKIAQQMVSRFGMDLPHILDSGSLKRLREVRGIGTATATRAVAAWKKQAAVRDIMLFLHAQDLSAALCRRIYKALGDHAIDAIKENPYRLCLDVRGIGFKTADAIALNLAVPPSSEQRVLSGLVHQLREMTSAGNCGCPRDRFVAACAEMLGVDTDRVTEVLDAQLAEPEFVRRFVEYDGVIYPRDLARDEEDIARVLTAALREPPAHADRVNDDLIAWAADMRDMKLAPKQDQAVRMALTNRVAVITGGPGCGKTATLNVLLAAFRRLGKSVALVAPTGKAAQRAWEATGIEARTIHRLLGISSTEDEEESQIHSDILVIDETSMVDVPLMARVARAVQSNTSVVMVGDVDQLPSVGPGHVLADIIKSGVVPVTVLDEVFRQAAGSAIITNAHAINHGAVPTSSGVDGDFFVLTDGNTRAIANANGAGDAACVAEVVADEILGLVCKRLPAKYGFDPLSDIQVLTPMNKGSCGVIELNRRLQEALNPKPDQYVNAHGSRFGIGDRVIQCKNNYALDVFNGDVGMVTGVGNDDETLKVRFEGRFVAIPFDDLGDLKLAYAMTIHKSQGSQAPAVVIPMVTQHWVMLQRNLLYTGVTRASKLAVVVGQQRAIATAVRRTGSKDRVTRLAGLLAGSRKEVRNA